MTDLERLQGLIAEQRNLEARLKEIEYEIIDVSWRMRRQRASTAKGAASIKLGSQPSIPDSE